MLTKEIINSFKNLTVLCVGDIMLDKFFYGEVERISPEAPVPIFKIVKEKLMLGGTGNVIANLASLGIKTKYAGVSGNDESGIMLEHFLKETNCEFSLLKPQGYPTTTKIRMIASNNHLIRADKETFLTLDTKQIQELKDLVEKEIKNADIVLISDYKKGLLTVETTQMIISLCKKYDKKALVDPKERDFSKYAHADIVKPNLKEFELVSGEKFDTQAPDFKIKIQKCAHEVMEKYNISNLLITLSKDGMIFVPGKSSTEKTNKLGDTIQISAEAKEVFDVSGAGDTSLAVLGASLAAGASVTDSMKLANLASGIVVGKLGTACVTPQELKEAIDKANGIQKLSQASKIINIEEAKNIIKSLKEKNKIIGFTNGCFDVMHLGHIHSFAGAKNECDFLFVGINSDKSVKRLKGDKYPLQNEKTRAYVAASLEFVDYVVLFDEDTALELVEELKPDVIAKEGYKIENWPEAQKVISYGGRAVELERVEDYSTSAVLQKIDNLNTDEKGEGALNV